MKKKFVISLLVIVSLFTITGCGKGKSKVESSDNSHKTEFVDMRFNEPKNYSKKEPTDLGDNKVLVYRFNEDENKTINLYYYTNTNLANVDEKFEEVSINGITWKKYHNTDFGVTYDTYDYIYNNGLYRIELNAVDKYEDEFNEFMKDVSFD